MKSALLIVCADTCLATAQEGKTSVAGLEYVREANQDWVQAGVTLQKWELTKTVDVGLVVLSQAHRFGYTYACVTSKGA